MKKKIPAVMILLILLFSLTPSAVAATTTTKGVLYEDAIFDLEEKLALWENLEEDTETRELERMKEVFANLSGASAQYSKGFRQYIEVLINIAYESYDSIDDLLFQMKKNLDFCSQLENRFALRPEKDRLPHVLRLFQSPKRDPAEIGPNWRRGVRVLSQGEDHKEVTDCRRQHDQAFRSYAG